ncbi:11321_t:CDS:2 [Entrophospora sp. SA101]|nr:11321_t:CDS:2 [Entrophospora sp. SA101]
MDHAIIMTAPIIRILKDGTELSHTECAKSSTPGKAIRDRSKCLQTLKCVFDKYLKKDLSESDVKDSKMIVLPELDLKALLAKIN